MSITSESHRAAPGAQRAADAQFGASLERDQREDEHDQQHAGNDAPEEHGPDVHAGDDAVEDQGQAGREEEA